MVNYGNGKIYKIISDQTDLIYIGSTTRKLCDRKCNHKSLMKCSSREILQYEDAEIILIESYSCNSKEELKSREQYYMDKFRKDGFNVINKNRAIGLDENRKKNNAKDYYEKNKDKIKDLSKNYHQNKRCKTKLKEKDKRRYENNKEKMKIQMKENYEKNRHEKIEYAREVRFMNNKKRVNEVCNFIEMINQY